MLCVYFAANELVRFLLTYLLTYFPKRVPALHAIQPKFMVTSGAVYDTILTMRMEYLDCVATRDRVVQTPC